MEMELRLTKDSRALPSVQAFVRSTLKQFGWVETTAAAMERTVTEVVSHTIKHAYPHGEEGAISLKVTEASSKLEITICDSGLPQAGHQLEDEPHDSQGRLIGVTASGRTGGFDEMYWSALGLNGKALHLIKWIRDDSFVEANSGTPPQVSEDAPVAPKDYEIRKAEPGEAAQISQLIYRIYGRTYFNEDVYYPERIATHHSDGSLVSVIATDAEGNVAGHCALQFKNKGPVAEVGLAAVDARHRARGLLYKMKDALGNEARLLGLTGWYADSVTVHIYTQKSNAHHGGLVCGVGLGVSPREESFGGIAQTLTQRVSCVVYFHWLSEPEIRTVFVPERHREIILDIYRNLGCAVTLGEGETPEERHGTLSIDLNPRAHFAVIHVTRLGQDSVGSILRAARKLIAMSH